MPISNPAGVTKHTELTDKEIAGVIDHADLSVTRAKLEYPTIDVNFGYLTLKGKTDWVGSVLCTTDTFTDKAIENKFMAGTGGEWTICARMTDTNNFYQAKVYVPATAGDFQVGKCVAGVWTLLASEAVDLSPRTLNLIKLSVSGSTIKCFREDMTTPKITITDTSLTNGKFGVETFNRVDGWVVSFPTTAYLRAPASPPPQYVSIVQTNVLGSGTEQDPFRPNVPKGFSWCAFNYVSGNRMCLLIVRGDYSHSDVESAFKNKTSFIREVPRTTRDFNNFILDKDTPHPFRTTTRIADLQYQLFGHKIPAYELYAVANFYNQYFLALKQRVAKEELQRTLQMWIDRAKAVHPDHETIATFNRYLSQL